MHMKQRDYLLILSLNLGLLACQSVQRSLATEQPASSDRSEAVTQIKDQQPVLTQAQFQPPYIQAQDATARIQGAPNVEKWEPSGVALYEGDLWVVSDKDGWLARYTLPLQKVSQPVQVIQIKLPLDHRLKWEGLEVHPQGGLLMMEAISRSVWWCKDPKANCSELSKISSGAVNDELNTLANRDFYYLMFEALTVIEGQAWVGVRGMNAKASADHEGGLVPWIAWASFNGEPALPIVPPNATQSAFLDQKRVYGLSGAVNDGQGGLWVTLSFEDEEGDSRESVSGILAHLQLPLSSVQLTGAQPKAKVCARFDMKPEGVTLTNEGLPIVVFDVDSDRKGQASHQFNLARTEDYVWVASEQIKGCLK